MEDLNSWQPVPEKYRQRIAPDSLPRTVLMGGGVPAVGVIGWGGGTARFFGMQLATGLRFAHESSASD
jgi:hypothetical protein